MEEWRPVPGYKGLYEVSDQGRVRSLPRIVRNRYGPVCPVKGHIMTLHPTEWGYLRVRLIKPGQRFKSIRVHRIVFHAFNGWMPKELNHKDLDKANNRKENLEPSSRQHNQAHAKANGRYLFPNLVRKIRPNYICKHCGTPFTKQKHHSRPTHFCSRRCAARHQHSLDI